MLRKYRRKPFSPVHSPDREVRELLLKKLLIIELPSIILLFSNRDDRYSLSDATIGGGVRKRLSGNVHGTTKSCLFSEKKSGEIPS